MTQQPLGALSLSGGGRRRSGIPPGRGEKGVRSFGRSIASGGYGVSLNAYFLKILTKIAHL